ncbi:hypothetical protein BT69DRAFT_1357870 [Atractiella rhizophila]|nr:hypothetical protein BT69DRAFT_1357870 [Atractiella rhizophila]
MASEDLTWITDPFKNPNLVPSPNNGRFQNDGTPSRRPPGLLSHPQGPEGSVDIHLRVDNDFHWAVVWEVGRVGRNISYSFLHVVQDRGAEHHYTNWGLFPKIITPQSRTYKSTFFQLGSLHLQDRLKLTDLAERIPPLQPVEGLNLMNVVWPPWPEPAVFHCRIWIKELLAQAVRVGYFTQASVDEAITDAEALRT